MPLRIRSVVIAVAMGSVGCTGPARAPTHHPAGIAALQAPPAPPQPRTMPPGFAGVMPRPIDPEAAIRSEFAAVAEHGTAEAFRVFAARHPDHPLAREALRRARALAGGAP